MAATDLKRKFQCRECGKLFLHRKTLQNHLLLHRGITFSCSSCSEVFTCKGNLQRHVKFTHTDTTSKDCTICNKKIKPSSMPGHMKHHRIEQEDFSCQQCGAKLLTKKTLRAHLLSHHANSKQFPCNLCDASFTARSNLKNHLSLKHGQGATFNCTACETVCTQRADLIRHIKRFHKNQTTTPRTRACPVCKIVIKPSSMAQHLKLHDQNTGKRLYPCHRCDAKLSSKAIA